jgi:hypothetical protein
MVGSLTKGRTAAGLGGKGRIAQRYDRTKGRCDREEVAREVEATS